MNATTATTITAAVSIEEKAALYSLYTAIDTANTRLRRQLRLTAMKHPLGYRPDNTRLFDLIYLTDFKAIVSWVMQHQGSDIVVNRALDLCYVLVPEGYVDQFLLLFGADCQEF